MTGSTEWTDFVKLVQASMRVEKSLAEGKTEREGKREGSRTGQASGTPREKSH